MNFTEIRHEGYYRGRNIASRIDLPKLGDSVRFVDDLLPRELTDDAEIETFCLEWAYAIETADRDFSPFEFTAGALNNRDDSEEAWEQFDDGIYAGIRDEITARLAKRAA